MVNRRNCYSYIPQRWVIVFTAFMGTFTLSCMNFCLSITILRMVQPVNHVESTDNTCPDTRNMTSESKSYNHYNVKSYDWSEITQGLILSSFFCGHLFGNFIGGIFCQKLGSKNTYSLMLLSCAVLTCITPISIEFGGSNLLICIRVIDGFCQGPMSPAIGVLMSQWIPKNERSKAGGIVYSSITLGMIFSTSLSGLILEYCEWPAIFYVFSGIAFINVLLNCILCYNKPSEHPFISETEVKYLQEEFGKEKTQMNSNVTKIPWRSILTSAPIWALMFAMFSSSCLFFTITLDGPKYVSNILKFSAENTSYSFAIPYLSKWLVSILVSISFDCLIARNVLSIGAVRKIGFMILSFGSGICFLAASYVGCNGPLVILLFTIGLTFMCCGDSSIAINAMDLCPNNVGAVIGMSTAMSTLSGIVTPYLIGIMTTHQTITEWRLVFWINFIIIATSGITFLIFGSGEKQSWDDSKVSIEEKKVNNNVNAKICVSTIA